MSVTAINTDIDTHCQAWGRERDDVTLIAVSKKQPLERITHALDSGQRVFGENRVQEAMERWVPLQRDYPDVTLHFIGGLQTNKVKEAVALFDVIHSVDRKKLAKTLADEMQKQGRNLPCLIQVNTGEEEQKSGVNPAELPELLRYCIDDCGLNITGLMAIPPQDDVPLLHFALLQKLAKRHQLPHLSMGMSGDYHKAIRMGATYVRIGAAIFGERP